MAIAYMVIVYFIWGLVGGTFVAGFGTLQLGLTGDSTMVEDGLMMPYTLAAGVALCTFVSTFVWVYVIWSAVQFILSFGKPKKKNRA